VRLYESPSGRLRGQQRCSGDAPVRRMRPVEKSADELAEIWREARAEELDPTLFICRCAWNQVPEKCAVASDWAAVAQWEDEQTDAVDLWISPENLASARKSPYGTVQLEVTSGDEKEMLTVLVSRTDLAIISDLVARCGGKTVGWEIADYAVLSAVPTA
jgi:hypothetical protein